MMWAGSKSFGTCATCMQVDTVRPVTPPQTKEGASMLQLQLISGLPGALHPLHAAVAPAAAAAPGAGPA